MCYPIMIHGKNSPWQLPLQYQQIPSAPEWERTSKMRPVSVIAELRATHIRHGQGKFSPLRLECQWYVCLRISSTDPCSPAWPQTVCKRFFRGRQQLFWSWNCDLEVPGLTGTKRLARLSTDLVGSIILCHLLSQQEHALVPLQLLIHRLVESISDSDLTKNMRKIITPWHGGHT